MSALLNSLLSRALQVPPVSCMFQVEEREAKAEVFALREVQDERVLPSCITTLHYHMAWSWKTAQGSLFTCTVHVPESQCLEQGQRPFSGNNQRSIEAFVSLASDLAFWYNDEQLAHSSIGTMPIVVENEGWRRPRGLTQILQACVDQPATA